MTLHRYAAALLLALSCAAQAAGTYTDRSGTITAGGVSQQLVGIDPTRKSLHITHSTSETEPLCVNTTSAASCSTAGSYVIAPGGMLCLNTVEAVNIVAATTGHKFTAKEGDQTCAVLVNGGSATITGGGDATAANQTTQITAEQAIQAGVGATTDAAVAAGAAGSLNAKTRLQTTLLDTIATEVAKIDDANTQLPAALGPQTPANSLATFNAAATGAQTSVNDTNADTTCLAANAARKGATVANDSSSTLYLLLANAVSSATAYTVRMAQNDYYEVPYSYTGVIKCIWSADSTGAARVTEITN